MGQFTQALGELTAALEPADGWYAVFLRRDPEGMDACSQGREMLPWDVAEALLQDFAALYGIPATEQVYERVREAYRVAAAAYDARPGGRQALLGRLDVMIRERRYAAVRLRRLAGSAPGAGSAVGVSARNGTELAWAEDDVNRASARCAELRRRLEALDVREAGEGRESRNAAEAAARATGSAGAVPRRPGAGGVGPGRSRTGEAAPAGPGSATGPIAPSAFPAGLTGPAAGASFGAGAPSGPRAPLGPEGSLGPAPSSVPPASSELPTEPGTGRRPRSPGPAAGRAGEPESPRRAAPKRAVRPRGARFAGLETEEVDENTARAEPPAATGPGPDPGPGSVPGPPAAAPAAPRGARFAGAYETGERDEDGERRERASARNRELLAAARDEARETAARLRVLRAAGRGGEAYALLCEAVSGAPHRLPLLAGALEREGLAAEVATLVWEAAALPPPALAAVAGALADAGRGDDCRALLAQCAGRPAAEVADTALALRAAGRHDETAVLLGGMLRARTDEQAVRVAETAPGELVPPLLEAAAGSPQRYRNLAHVLRGAGLPGVPDTV
ncbi:hypothetical protein [Streptomyces albus]|uniref:hypothetical protein n=1 Tax=Streptomyces albus TaxID=1888 RepID=UPI0005638C7E|nr:hypothetical protein [Streptomyces albus]